MNRRRLLKSAAAAALLPNLAPQMFAAASAATPTVPPLSRVRPADPAWPSSASWGRLNHDVGGRLIEVKWPLRTCRDDPVGMSCDDAFAELANPYYIADQVGLTQTAGSMHGPRGQASSLWRPKRPGTSPPRSISPVHTTCVSSSRVSVTAISGPRTRRIRC